MGAAGAFLSVRPLRGQSAVESFDLSVCPWAVGFDEFLDRAQRGHGVFECVGFSVGERVIGDDSFDAGNAVVGEILRRPGQDRGGGGAFLVGLDLGVGQAGVVVNDGVDVVEGEPADVLPLSSLT